MKKITVEELFVFAEDLEVSDEELLQYFEISSSNDNFGLRLFVNSEKVHIEQNAERENLLKIANGISRLRRKIRFKKTFSEHPDRSVVIVEGDSWVSIPIFDDIVNHLSSDEHKFNIYSLAAAGDTLDNMVNNTPEFHLELAEYATLVKAFIFSGAGNDILGKDPQTDKPVLDKLVLNYSGNNNARQCVNHEYLNSQINTIIENYTRLVKTVRNINGLEKLPILLHGYDYVFPYKHNSEDRRSPIYLPFNKDKWLGSVFKDKGYPYNDIRREVTTYMLNILNDKTKEFARNHKYVYFVDCRNAVTEVTQWYDEIHPNADGFSIVADRFANVLNKVIS